jgi:hypothetical protein
MSNQIDTLVTRGSALLEEITGHMKEITIENNKLKERIAELEKLVNPFKFEDFTVHQDHPDYAAGSSLIKGKMGKQDIEVVLSTNNVSIKLDDRTITVYYEKGYIEIHIYKSVSRCYYLYSNGSLERYVIEKGGHIIPDIASPFEGEVIDGVYYGDVDIIDSHGTCITINACDSREFVLKHGDKFMLTVGQDAATRMMIESTNFIISKDTKWRIAPEQK